MDQENVEDGEIVEAEEMDLECISDDENFETFDSEDLEQMKQRILELEQRNLELEKIAVISRTYDLDYGKDYVTISDEYDEPDYTNGNKKSSENANSRKRHSDNLHYRSVRNKKWHRSPSPIHRHRSPSPIRYVKHCDRVPAGGKKRRRSASPDFRRHRVITMLASPVVVKHQIDRKRTRRQDEKKTHRVSNDDKLAVKRKKSKRSVVTTAVSSESEPEFEVDHRRKLSAALKRGDSKKSTLSSKTNVLKNKLQNIMMSKKLKPTSLHGAKQHEDTPPPPTDEEDEELKLRLLALKSKQEVKEIIVEHELTKINVESNREEISAEEQELRIIALKSAVMKKANARKLRKENEQPYSPTDDVICPTFVVSAPEISLLADSELKIDIDCNMEISPVSSPTPAEQCEPIDMELESDDSNLESQQLTEFSMTAPTAIVDKTGFYFNGPWSLPIPVPLIPVTFPMVTPPLTLCSASVLPEVPNVRHPSTTDESIQDLAKSLDVDLNESPEHTVTNDLRPKTPLGELTTKETYQKSENSKEVSPKAVDDDEEALLRSMLLSSVRKKLDTEPFTNPPPPSPPPPSLPPPVVEEPKVPEMTADASFEAEQLRNLLLTSLNNKKTVVTPLEKPPSAEVNLKEVAERWKQSEKAKDDAKQQKEDLRKALEKLKQTKVAITPQKEVVESKPATQEPKKQPLTVVPAVKPVKQLLQTIPKLINRSVLPSTPSEQPKVATVKRKIAKVLPRTTAEVAKKVAPITTVAKAQPPKRPLPVKKLKPTVRPVITKVMPSNKKLTNLDQIIKPVARLVINLGADSDSDSDFVDDGGDDTTTITVFRDLDNQSPSHVMIGSPKSTVTTTAESRIRLDNGVATEPKVKSTFDLKLDAFLKNVRSKVEQISNLETNRSKATATVKTPVTPKIVARPGGQKTQATPTAVRHLPANAQQEYKRLIQRMNQLEKQKEQKSKPARVVPPVVMMPKVPVRPKTPEVLTEANLQITITNEESTVENPLPSPGLKIILNHSGRQVQESDETDKPSEVIQKSPRYTDVLRKQVLIKNYRANSVNTKPNEASESSDALAKAIVPIPAPITVASEKPADSEIQPPVPKKPTTPPVKTIVDRIMTLNEADRQKFLFKYESNYQENSHNFFNDLEKLIGAISEAQIQRHKQFQLENEVDELRTRLTQLETELDAQKKSISKIFPSIADSHKTILEARNRHTQLSTVCIRVGTIIKGPSYQLSNDKNKAIGSRLKDLSTEIKKLKSMDRDTVKQQQNVHVKQEPTMNGNDNDDDDDQVEVIEIPVKIIEIPDSPVHLKTRDSVGRVSPNTTLLEGIDVEKTEDGYLDDENQLDQPPVLPTTSKAKYQSPLEHFQRKGSAAITFNPDNVLCPFQMNGQCEDDSCAFQHFL